MRRRWKTWMRHFSSVGPMICSIHYKWYKWFNPLFWGLKIHNGWKTTSSEEMRKKIDNEYPMAICKPGENASRWHLKVCCPKRNHFSCRKFNQKWTLKEIKEKWTNMPHWTWKAMGCTCWHCTCATACLVGIARQWEWHLWRPLPTPYRTYRRPCGM